MLLGVTLTLLKAAWPALAHFKFAFITTTVWNPVTEKFGALAAIYGTPPDTAAAGEALKFFDWAYKNGGKMASELDYVPLPEGLIKQVRATWKSDIKGVTVAAN